MHEDNVGLAMLKLAAEEGNAQAQYELAEQLWIGESVAQDPEQAMECYFQAAEQGVAEAQYHLGTCYWVGALVPQSFNKAMEWLQPAAEQGLIEAQMLLACGYAQSDNALHNDSLAAYWYQQAASQGNSDAQYQLDEHFSEYLDEELPIDPIHAWTLESVVSNPTDLAPAIFGRN